MLRIEDKYWKRSRMHRRLFFGFRFGFFLYLSLVTINGLMDVHACFISFLIFFIHFPSLKGNLEKFLQKKGRENQETFLDEWRRILWTFGGKNGRKRKSFPAKRCRFGFLFYYILKICSPILTFVHLTLLGVVWI